MRTFKWYLALMATAAICVLALYAAWAGYPHGSLETADGTGDFGVDLGYKADKITIYAPTADIGIKLCKTGDNEVCYAPAGPAVDDGDSDAVITIKAGIPANFTDTPADSVYVDRTSTTPVTIWWE
jgi:hypothetical protein